MNARAPIALSHSRLSDYNSCPLKFKLKYLDKAFPEEEKTVHLIRGDNVHKALEKYAIKKIVKESGDYESSLPEVTRTMPVIDKMVALFPTAYAEQQLSVDNNFRQVEWFSKLSYYRVIVDFTAHNESQAIAFDWKTGKLRDYSGWGGQLHLTAAVIFSVLPTIEEVTTVYHYVDHDKQIREKFTRKDLPELIAHFHSEWNKVNNDFDFKPTSNEFCKYCPATRKQCPYSRKSM